MKARLRMNEGLKRFKTQDLEVSRKNLVAAKRFKGADYLIIDC